MTRQSIEILNAIVNYNEKNDEYGKRLIIIEPRDTNLTSKSIGPFVSFEDSTSEDFFEIYRYKKSMEESKDKNEGRMK